MLDGQVLDIEIALSKLGQDVFVNLNIFFLPRVFDQALDRLLQLVKSTRRDAVPVTEQDICCTSGREITELASDTI